jgi:hypothetical protein
MNANRLCHTAKRTGYDVVVYGQTSAGVIAAVQAKRMGKTVIVVGPDRHLGGLSSGGLGSTDIGNKRVIGGLSRQFYRRVGEHYGTSEMWTFEPHVAEQVFEDFVTEHAVTVHRDAWLDRTPGRGVAMKNGRIVSITMLSGKTYHGNMFIDATYEGDLMAAAGVSYTFGREPSIGVLLASNHGNYFQVKISCYWRRLLLLVYWRRTTATTCAIGVEPRQLLAGENSTWCQVAENTAYN